MTLDDFCWKKKIQSCIEIGGGIYLVFGALGSFFKLGCYAVDDYYYFLFLQANKSYQERQRWVIKRNAPSILFTTQSPPDWVWLTHKNCSRPKQQGLIQNQSAFYLDKNLCLSSTYQGLIAFKKGPK